MSVMIGGEQSTYNFNRADFLSRTERRLSNQKRLKLSVVRRTLVAEIVMPRGARQIISVVRHNARHHPRLCATCMRESVEGRRVDAVVMRRWIQSRHFPPIAFSPGRCNRSRTAPPHGSHLPLVLSTHPMGVYPGYRAPSPCSPTRRKGGAAFRGSQRVAWRP